MHFSFPGKYIPAPLSPATVVKEILSIKMWNFIFSLQHYITLPLDKINNDKVIWVSGSAGAVGGMVGQVAKQVFNCKVIGSCGGPEKCELVKVSFSFFLPLYLSPTPKCVMFLPLETCKIL
jgi:NADPH:quinone reductase-like Zn-dependent oxidoreductase